MVQDPGKGRVPVILRPARYLESELNFGELRADGCEGGNISGSVDWARVISTLPGAFLAFEKY